MTDWFLLRGLTREQRHWGDFPQQLEARIAGRPLMLDMPGFGTEHRRPSPATIAGITDDLRARLRPRLSGPAGIVALSLGGMVALDWCARYPQDFQRLVLINTSTRDLSLPWARMRLGVAATLVRSRLSRDVMARERVVLQTTTARHGANDTLARQWATWAEESPPHRLAPAQQLLAALRFAMPRGLQLPTLVLTSHGDQLCNPSCSRAIARHLAAELREHPTAGHDISLDDPAWVIEQLATFKA